ncbi:MAG: diaminopimelate decarboxylase [Gammaproteobacteria bacterium]|nr:diaminopimelate decarboxylase [Gammaproteobacteria bacterium]
MPHFSYRDGELCAEQVPLSEIAARFGTPCFIYSRAAIETGWRAYDDAFAGRSHLVCYAVKANGNLALLHLLARLGSGFDIVSGGELERVLRAGGDPARIVFSGVGKRADEIDQALAAGIGCFNVESAAELRRLERIAGALGKRARVALRVNPDVDAGTHPYIATALKESKFGIAHREALAVYREAARSPHLQVTGIACHIGSQITSLEPFIDAFTRVLQLADSLRVEGMDIDHVDMGGGLGIRYRDEAPPAPEQLVQALCARIGQRTLKLMLEPGRSVVGEAGVLLTRVEYLKYGAARNFAIVDAAMNDLLRPSLYDAWQDILPVRQQSGSAPQTFDVVGPVCESADFLGLGRSLAIAEGDLLAVASSGAYAACMSSNYNARPRAAEILVDGSRAHEVRRRESIETLLTLESIPPE